MGEVAQLLVDYQHYNQPAMLLSGDADQNRRSLNSLFDCAYRLVNVRRGQHADYRHLADASDFGQTTRALMLVRGTRTHRPDLAVAFEHHQLYPGPKLFPGRWTFPGVNPFWLPFDAVDWGGTPPTGDDRAAYERWLEGQILGYAFDAAWLFLVEDPRLGPLPD